MRRLAEIGNEELERVLALSGQTLWLVAADGTILDVLGSLESRLGYGAEELRGSSLRDLIGPEDLDELAHRFSSMAKAALDGNRFEIELRATGKDGTTFDVKVTGTVPLNDGPGELAAIGLTTDITLQKQAERALENERLRFFRTFEHAPNGIVLLHIDPERGGLIKGANATACRITGRDEDDLVGTWLIDGELTELVDAEVDEAFEQSREMLVGDLDRFTVGRILKRPDGSRVHIKAAVSALEAEEWESGTEERPINAIVHIEDVTEQRQAEDELQHQAEHDSLTDLLNRRRFIALLTEQLELGWHGQAGGALLMIDLDGFKSVNDAHGHLAGDRVLLEVARILRSELRDTDPVARLGGDEFAALLPEVDRADAIFVARSLLDRLVGSKIPIPGTEDGCFLPSVSIGVVLLDGRPVEPETVLRDCDLAMYEAKHRGGGCLEIASQ